MRTVDLGRPIELLLVEDNAADVRLLQEALKELKMPTQLSTVADGLEALAFLRREGRYAQALQPDLILLDLNLPGKSGLEVLAEISAHPHLRHIPLVVLTSSAAEQDILQSYMLCANCFITKPVDLEHLLTAIRVLGEFWFTVVQLPSALGQPLA